MTDEASDAPLPAAAAAISPGAPPPELRHNVFVLGVAALFNDIASEMAYWVLPYFLTVLGAGPGWLGLIEGAAEASASWVKVWSGGWADRTQRRKPLVVAGYFLSNVMKPLLGFTQAAGQVLAVRTVERGSKGLRSVPRDVMITESAAPGQVGAAFGLRQALDSAGAVIGPAVAFWLMLQGGQNVRLVFWAAAIPGAIAVILVWALARETGQGRVAIPQPASALQPTAMAPPASFSHALWLVLVATGLFGLANFSDMFLILRAQHLGVRPALAPLLGLVFNAVFAALSYPLGRLSDRWPRKWLVGTGYLVYAAVYYGFARDGSVRALWGLFAAYGLYQALTAGVISALIADCATPANRGRAFGWVAGVTGVTGFAASALAGGLWHWRGPALPFDVAAALAVAAAGLIFLLPPRPVQG
ncbi:MAG: MFS transporter [Terriglobales bacterium]